MNNQTVSGFQAVEEMFSKGVPTNLSWSPQESEKLSGLMERGKRLSEETEELAMIFKMTKPFEENDDEIDNMLNWEAWRLEFETHSPLHKDLKQKEAGLQQELLAFMRKNGLFFTFTVVEMKRRLVEPYEVFDTYATLQAVESRLQELSGYLSDGKVNYQDAKSFHANVYQIG